MTDERTRAVMRGNRSTDTLPELGLRRNLHRRGLRFRIGLRLRTPFGWVRPDIVFTKRKVAVFVDGCFWHACPEHLVHSLTNQTYWRTKLDSNVRRDAHVTAALAAGGWRVLRIWEHDVKESSERAADGVAKWVGR